VAQSQMLFRGMMTRKGMTSENWSREKMSCVLLFLWAKYIYLIKIRHQLVEVCGDYLRSVQ